ncbi:hypothetical protein F4861DRAFT_536878 [Xylaria intraflava]|nr:hypothetical protein F4861DRAFT_536878 [Xylaria intraflava]
MRRITRSIPRRWTSTKAPTPPAPRANDVNVKPTKRTPEAQQTPKTTAQQDEELRQKMSSLAGDGGEAGVEYEDGKPVALKRGKTSPVPPLLGCSASLFIARRAA